MFIEPVSHDAVFLMQVIVEAVITIVADDDLLIGAYIMLWHKTNCP